MRERIRWGILGTASIVPALINGIRQSGNGVVTAVASRDGNRAKEFAAQHGIANAFASYGDLITSGSVDAIYNPLPNSLHAEWTIHCLQAGVPVLCEKPFTATLQEAREVLAVSQETGVPVTEAFMYRYHPLYDKLTELLLQGAIGNIVMMHSAFTFFLQNRAESPASAELAGGSLMDVGCYCVNLARLLTDSEPEGAMAFERRTSVDDSLVGALLFPERVLAQVECSIEAYERGRAEIVGSQGSILLERPWFPGEARGEIILRRDQREERIETPGGNGYHLEAEDFADAVLQGRPPRWTAVDAVANMAAIEALLESARTGTSAVVESL
ncbi:MAG: Gfo/Idh/MocA family oxidoreductase [Candidatus Hydrogenedentes bacterium]|nr:Gfo/Idh/MocA family oxidoreductase [Candidatus Hydrogenedentota bacterium]